MTDARLAAIAVAVAVALVPAGCGGEDRETRSGRTLTIMGFGPGDEIANTRAAEARKAIAPAHVRNPRGAFNDQKFLATLAAGRPPDLIYLDRQKVGSLAGDAIVPLTSCIEDEEIDTSQYRRAALEEVTLNGEIYALPEFTNQRTLIVNDSVIRKAGVSLAQISTTDWDALRELNQRLLRTSGGRVIRIGFDPKIPEFFPLWAKANGVDLLEDDGTRANLDDPKAIEALVFAHSLIEDHGGWGPFKAFRDTWDFFGAANQVAKDQIGFWPMESWYYNVLAENSPQKHITAVAFTDRSGEALTFLSGNGWAIPRNAENPDLACTWMKAMTAATTWVKAAKARAAADKAEGQPFTGLYTANRVADQRILETVYEPVDPSFDAAVRLLVDIQEHAFALPASPAGAEFNRAMTDAVNRVLTGRQTPAQALRQAQEEAQAALDEARR